MKDNEWAGVGNHIDFGARGLDTRIGRWIAKDPLFLKYPSESPYSFALNSPIEANDPDGRIVIFVNGQHKKGDVGEKYWENMDAKIRNIIGDTKYLYYDGSLGGWSNSLNMRHVNPAMDPQYSNLSAKERYEAGYKKGKEDAQSIIDGLQRNKDGEIIESIKLIAHSMGGAYAKGVGNGILDYANLKQMKGVKIEFEVDFASFQPGSIYNTAIPGVRTIQVSHKFDGVVNSKFSLEGSYETKEKGVSLSDYHLNTTDKNKGHNLQDFKDEINYVPKSSSNGGNGNGPASSDPK